MCIHVFVEFDEMNELFAFRTFGVWEVIIGSSFLFMIGRLQGRTG